jgi:PTH1 family peptidyl-tRNA hydrolase
MVIMIDPSQNIEIQPKIHQGPFIIAGLGNPGRKYERNRHNVGFMLLNRLSNKLGESFGKIEAKALVCKTSFQGERIILVKPQSYMNKSGMPVASLVRFYQIPLENLLVTYDDVDLPLGVLRIRPSGGSGGQKGMQSIIERLGTEEFPRLRIGTGRPPGRMDAADYVLQDFSSQETELLDDSLDRGVKAVLAFVSNGLDNAMNAFNG